MRYLFTSESVSEGHPDKVADQISDAILDEYLRQDPESKVACESFCTTGRVVVMGEIHSTAKVDVEAVIRQVIARIGYDRPEYLFDAASVQILNFLHEQSEDIRQGVDREVPEEQGAGDQGMMFGYACRETEDYMPLPLYLSHRLLQVLADIRHNHPELMPYLRPDAKSQFTVEYDDATRHPVRIHTIVLSTQHDEFGTEEAMAEKIRADVNAIVLPRLVQGLPAATAALFDEDVTLLVNPTGKFVIGGPHGDTGLTGRKIVVDTYGGRCAHGGGAFSGKDPSKVDRSAAYATRYVAKNMVAAGVADVVMVQVSYAIGKAEPLSVYVNTFGTDHTGLGDAAIAEKVGKLFDFRPAAIIRRFALKHPIYSPTAAYGHMGRKPYVKDGMQFFGWERLDSVDAVRKDFGLA